MNHCLRLHQIGAGGHAQREAVKQSGRPGRGERTNKGKNIAMGTLDTKQYRAHLKVDKTALVQIRQEATRGMADPSSTVSRPCRDTWVPNQISPSAKRFGTLSS